MFTTYILKLTGYCNLDCGYCYMFRGADRTFEQKPREMALETAGAALSAIAREARRTDSGRVSVILHGGEPTLWPDASFEGLFDAVSALRREGLHIECGIQTNLLKPLTEQRLALFRRHGLMLGVSLDGPKSINDVNRPDFAGHGSYDRVIGAVRDLFARGYDDLFGGFLSVVQPEIPPPAFLDWILSLPATRVNLLWPLHYTAGRGPWGEGEEAAYAVQPRYGAWLAELFELWLDLDRPDISIPLFERAVQFRIAPSRIFDDVGALSFSSLVINTDGAVELADYFRTACDGATHTPYSILTDTLEAVSADPRIAALREAADEAPEPCRDCRHMLICQGGTLSGRIDPMGGIAAEPSVLCHDHMRFFDTVAQRIDPLLTPERELA